MRVGAWFTQLAPRSIFLFKETNPVRQFAVALMLWKWFDRFIISVIIVNSIFMGLSDYSLDAVDPVSLEPDGNLSWRNALSSVSEPYFTAIFVFEAVVKIVAMGFILDPGSYLQDTWNWYVRGKVEGVVRGGFGWWGAGWRLVALAFWW